MPGAPLPDAAPTHGRPAGAPTTRSKARKRALDVLFEADARAGKGPEGGDPVRALHDLVARAQHPLNPYVSVLVEGVAEHLPRLDELLSRYSQGWTLDRMPAVDRSLLRLSTYELLYRLEVPAPVVISEAVALAAALSTDESPGFVNGVLGALVEQRSAVSAMSTVSAVSTVPAGADPSVIDPPVVVEPEADPFADEAYASDDDEPDAAMDDEDQRLF